MATDQDLDDLTHLIPSPAQQARDWFMLLESDQATGADRERFARWLSLDSEHAQAFAELEAITQATANMADLKSLEPLESASPSLWQKLGSGLQNLLSPSYAFAAVSMLAVALVSWPFISSTLTPEATAPVSYQTAKAEDREIFLPDGSVVTLAANSRIEISLSETQRHINLAQGEAFFDVAKDAKRPFIVDTRDSRVTVLGTHFNVNTVTGFSQVSVEEGRVEVSSLQQQDAEVLTAGQRVQLLNSGSLSPVANIEPSAAGAWRRGLRIYFDAKLEDVLLDLNRYSPQAITLGEENLHDLSVTAIFPADDIDLMLQALDNTLPLRLEKTDETVTLYAEKPGS
ncbi:FecR family protein [Maricurvus nonylphenolicus]|uniref:FecR family protein n=1 Tax=Maricurvus nonylphenolicus TaxID=1008307 RepID=UPI0036F382C4